MARMNLGLALLEDARPAEARSVLLGAVKSLERQGRRGVAAIAHVGLLGCAASLGDWASWDRAMKAALQLLAESSFADVDVAHAAEHAAHAAHDQPDRAQDAWMLAISQWRALGREEEALRAEEHLGG